MKRPLILAFLISLTAVMRAQEDKDLPDSVIIRQDTISVISEDSLKSVNDSLRYTRIEKFSSRYNLTRKIYDVIFRPLNRKPPDQSAEIEQESRFHRLGHGRIIRTINITTLDPFGYDLQDTSVKPSGIIQNTGNLLHYKSRSGVINNLLLFNTYDRYDSLLVKESERLIRSQTYIRDVFLEVVRATRDSIDIYFRVQDVWSTIPSLRLRSSEPGFGIKDINFAGTGSTFSANTRWRQGYGNISHVSYLMPNIRNSYISLNIQYMFAPGGSLQERVNFDKYFYTPVSYDPQYLFSQNSNVVRSIEINRPFYSPYARVAGGLFSGQMITTQNYLDNSDTLRLVSARTNINDFWIGRSWRIKYPVISEGITSFIISGRYVKVASPLRPQDAIERDLFTTKNFLFWNMSLSSRKYFRDRFIFNYGKTEDVPAGIIAGLTIGKEFHEKDRFYAGLNAGWGSYYKSGYFSAHLSYGTFKGEDGFHNGILTGRITYFTRLMNIGEWKLRQFIRPSFVFGAKRAPVENQPLRIGIKGFETIESLASNLFVLSLQTQTYAPKSIAGFNFGPYFFSHFGILGADPVMGSKNKYYSLMGVGVLIRNNYLLFDTFQVSISFYPYIPDVGYNILKSNAYKTSDYGFRDFQVTKPGIIE